ncbi:hypothetical protein B484DRAFT_64706, partial [Ochromonadaceae sp. CCMP2298]
MMRARMSCRWTFAGLLLLAVELARVSAFLMRPSPVLRQKLRASSANMPFIGTHELGGNVDNVSPDDLLECMLTDTALVKLTSQLYEEDRLQFVYLNKFLSRFYDTLSEEDEEDTVERSTFSRLMYALLDRDVERLFLYRESAEQSGTLSVNINPLKIASQLMKVRAECYDGKSHSGSN